MAVEKVPVDEYSGNWLSYDAWTKTYDYNVRFSAKMQLVTLYSGRSAKGAVIKDLNTGKQYQMFMTDFISAIIANVVDHGLFPEMEWEAVKRGANYGIRPVTQ